MAKRSKKRRAWISGEVRDLKTVASRKAPASKAAKKMTLRTRAGRQVITSPAKSETSVTTWSEAFSGE